MFVQNIWTILDTIRREGVDRVRLGVVQMFGSLFDYVRGNFLDITQVRRIHLALSFIFQKCHFLNIIPCVHS